MRPWMCAHCNHEPSWHRVSRNTPNPCIKPGCDCPDYQSQANHPINPRPPRRTMNKMQQQVATFQRTMGLEVAHRARPLPQELVPVSIELIREEFEDELIPALEAGDLYESADAITDLLYVTFVLACRMGLDVEPLFNEVQASNMSKLGADGQPIIAGPNDPDGVFEGRVKKGPNYFKPRLREIIDSGLADIDIAAAVAHH